MVYGGCLVAVWGGRNRAKGLISGLQRAGILGGAAAASWVALGGARVVLGGGFGGWLKVE